MEQRQKLVGSLRYMRENGLRLPRPPAGLVGAVVLLVLATLAVGVLISLLF
jgi:hypothetical protein